MTPCIPSTGQNSCHSSMPSFQEVSHHSPSSHDSLCPPSPTLSLSSLSMPAALVTTFLPMLLLVQSGRVFCLFPHTICIISLQIPIMVSWSLPKGNNHLFPSHLHSRVLSYCVFSPSLTQVLRKQLSFSSLVLLPLISVWARWSLGVSATPSPSSPVPL